MSVSLIAKKHLELFTKPDPKIFRTPSYNIPKNVKYGDLARNVFLKEMSELSLDLDLVINVGEEESFIAKNLLPVEIIYTQAEAFGLSSFMRLSKSVDLCYLHAITKSQQSNFALFALASRLASLSDSFKAKAQLSLASQETKFAFAHDSLFYFEGPGLRRLEPYSSKQNPSRYLSETKSAPPSGFALFSGFVGTKLVNKEQRRFVDLSYLFEDKLFDLDLFHRLKDSLSQTLNLTRESLGQITLISQELPILGLCIETFPEQPVHSPDLILGAANKITSLSFVFTAKKNDLLIDMSSFPSVHVLFCQEVASA